MSDTTADRELGLQDEDRLPWLEAVETDDEEEGFSPAKTIGFVVAALLALGLIVGGVMWLRGQRDAGPNGDGTLIAAQDGDYKVRPDEPGGMKVEGQGDSAFATSEGKEANGQIDQGAMPETPMTPAKNAQNAKPAMGAAKPVVTAVVPASSSKLAPPNAAKLPVAMPAGGGVVQLGAFGSAAIAESAWTRMVSANPSLGKLPKTVMQANVGGNTVYRLRANAGSPAAASALCKQVSNCMVVR